MTTVKRLARWTAEAVGILFGTAALVLTALYGWAHTEPGRTWIARNVAAALSLPGENVFTVGRLNGILPDAIRLVDVQASDPAGTWLSARKITLDWRPLDLLKGIFRVTALRIEDVEIQRIPPWTIETDVASDQAGLRYLPFDAVLERLSVEDILLGSEILGVAAKFRIDGVAAAAGSDRLLFSFALERTDGVAGHADFTALYHLTDRRLTLDSNINEPAGGLAARLLEIPELPPLVMNLNGDGPLNGWRGRLSGSLVDQARIEAGIELRGESPIGFRVAGEVETTGPHEDLPWRLLAGKTPFQIFGQWRQRPPRRLVLDNARFTGTAADLELSGEFEPDLLQVDARSSLVLKDDTLMARLLDGAEAEGITLGVEARGHLLQPEIRLEAAARRLHLPGLSTEAALARLTFQPDHAFGGGPPRGTLSGTGHFGSFLYDNVPELEPVFGRSYAWQIDGQLDLVQASLWADQVAVRTERAEVTGSSAFDFAGGTMNADLEIEVYNLGGLGQLLGIDVQGSARLAGPLELRDFGRTLTAPLAGRVKDVTLGEGISHALLTGESAVEATLSVDPGGNFWITDVLVVSAPARLTGKVGFTERFRRITADYSLAVADVGVLSKTLGGSLAGSGLFEGQARGATLDPRLSGVLSVADAAIAGMDFGQLEVDYSIENLPRKPGGHLEARATEPVDAMAARTDYVFDGPLLHLNETRLTAENTSVRGDITFLLGGGATAARASGRIGDLEPWLALAGLAGGGSAEAELQLATRNRRQEVRLDAALTAASVSLQNGSLLRVGEARAKLDTRDLDEGRDGRATLEASSLRLGELTLSELSLDWQGNAKDGTLRLTTAGRWFTDLALQASGRVRREGTWAALDLAGLNGEILGQKVSLLQPARFSRGEGSWEISGLELDFGGARLAVGATVDAERIAANIEAREVPVSLFGPLWLDSGMSGRLSGEVRVDGPRGDPVGSIALQVPDLQIGTVEAGAPLALSLAGDWQDGRLVVAGNLSGSTQHAAALSAELPLSLDPATLALSIPHDSALSGQVFWAGRAGDLWPLLPFPAHRLDGPGELRLNLAGTLEELETSGRLTLNDGEYESLRTGTLLREIHLTADLAGQRLTITSLSAKDGDSGRLTGAGTLDLIPAENFPFSLEAQLDKFTLIRRDEITASSNGRLSLEGSFAAATLSGQMRTQAIELKILDQLPHEVVALDVIEIDSASGAETLDRQASVDPSRFALALDVDLDIPRRAFLRGRGLDSEWAGRIEIGGSLEMPQLGGQLELVRGQLSIFGESFKLSEGSISFPDRQTVDPQVDVKAVNKSDDLMVTARVWGQATDPNLEISSNPELPDDEIISRLLFGKQAGQLSAAEAVQLAATLSELSGAGGGNVLDVTRGALGIDVLRVESIGTGDNEQPGLSAGKYVTDEIFIDLKQGLEADSGSVGIEIEVTPNISIESDIGQTGESNVGIKFKWDY